MIARSAHAADLTSGLDKPTTVVVFSDRRMEPQLWGDILSLAQQELATDRPPAISGSAIITVIRGDQMPLGIKVESSISVYLHGDCNLALRSSIALPHHITGALGWVERDHGRILPFVHIDCSLIGDLLRSRPALLAALADPTQRFQVMSYAIARVFLHEYLHIATQSDAHARYGVTKSEFDVKDLLAGAPMTAANTEDNDRPHAAAGRAMGR